MIKCPRCQEEVEALRGGVCDWCADQLAEGVQVQGGD